MTTDIEFTPGFQPVDGNKLNEMVKAINSGGGGAISITDGTHTVAGTTSLTVTGATVGGTTPNATLDISGGSNPYIAANYGRPIFSNPADGAFGAYLKGSSNSGGAGGTAHVYGGAGSTAGGQVIITSGVGAAGYGGAVTISSASGSAGGGRVHIYGGSATGSYNPGYVDLTGGAGVTNGGYSTLSGGAASAGQGGKAQVTSEGRGPRLVEMQISTAALVLLVLAGKCKSLVVMDMEAPVGMLLSKPVATQQGVSLVAM